MQGLVLFSLSVNSSETENKFTSRNEILENIDFGWTFLKRILETAASVREIELEIN